VLSFDNEENKIIIDRLKTRYTIWNCENTNPNATDKLAGKIFVVSGVFNSSLEMNWKKIEDNGGKIGSSISAKTNYVVRITWDLLS
jgi:DNA ligase (NAD+)